MRGAGRRGRAARRQLRRRAGALRRAGRASTGLTFVHPFDDPLVIAGQGTIGAEILRQQPGPLCRGVRAGGRRRAHRRRRRLHQGAAARGARHRRRAVRGRRDVPVAGRGRRVRLDHVGLFADGVAVREVGEHTFAHRARARSTRSCASTNDEICAAIKDVFDDTRSVMEPAGALAVAGLKTWAAARRALRGPDGWSPIAQRRQHELRPPALRGRARRAGRGARGRSSASPSPSGRALPRVLRAPSGRASSPSSTTASAAATRRTSSSACARQSREDAADAGGAAARGAATTPTDLTDNELAKLHVRHMVGGRSPRRARRAALPLRVPRAARAR